jgi:hypothetical protein
MKRYLIIHPFLFAMYPVLAVLAVSLSYIDPFQAIRPLIIFLVITSLILALFFWIYKDWYRSGFLTSIVVWMVFFYGYSYRLPKHINIFGISMSRHIIILCFWIIFFAIMSSNWLWIRIRPQVITNFLNITSGLALVYALYLICCFWYTARQDPLSAWTRPPNTTEDNISLSSSYRPDIYYIILDGYARNDILSELYSYDNSTFTNNLIERGFYVVTDSHSNYDETQLSLASSLNFEYLDYLSFAGGVSTNRYPLGKLILDSRVRSQLENIGYKTYISGEYLFSEITDPALVFFSTKINKFSTFESLLLETTMFEIINEETNINISTYTYATHRQKILDGFAEIPILINKNSPKFVFVHIIAPHPPFVFNENGEPIQPDAEYTIFDRPQFSGGISQYIEGYRQQVIYLNQLVITSIDEILQNSRTPPIIVLQADHGPGLLLNSSIENSCLKERFSILNSYYFPDGNYNMLYPSISSVNTFRIIFNHYFGTNYKILPNNNYFSWDDRYDFINVSNQVDDKCSISGGH